MPRFLLGLAISVVALWWAFRDTDWSAFGAALLAGNPWLIALSAAVLLLAVPIRGTRWRLFLRPMADVPLRVTSEATVVGYFGNNVLPVRMGEMLRAYFLARQMNLPVSKVLGTVLLDRMIDMASFLPLVVLLPLVAFVPPELRTITRLGIVMAMIPPALIWWLGRKDDVSWAPVRLQRLAGNMRSGFSSLRSGRSLPPIVLTTVALWTCYYFSLHFGQAAMGLNLTWGQTYSLLVVTTLVIAIPAAPGFVGTYHAAVIFMLHTVLGHSAGDAQAAAVVLHAIGFVPYTVLGAIFFLKSHIKLRAVMQQKPTAGEES